MKTSNFWTDDFPRPADLAADFVTSMGTQDPRLALNIMATAFNVGLAPWADPALRAISDDNDLDLAGQLISTPTVLILRCARRHGVHRTAPDGGPARQACQAAANEVRSNSGWRRQRQPYSTTKKVAAASGVSRLPNTDHQLHGARA